jgi:16S rRNA (cytidine1402-2'-O)-methyltransferase
VSGGELFVVSTPIGNLGDLSPRAAEVLGAADVVCAEDTRHTGLMLRRLGVTPRRLLSVHAYNERQRVPEILRELSAGRTVALVTDAGTPGVSDPGERVVASVAEAGFTVRVVPGPSAAVAALALAGAGASRWAFEGFLPRKGRERARRLAEIAASDRPVVLYESPQRLVDTLTELAEVCGPGRRVAVCRELTKLHEEVVRASLAEAVAHFRETPPRGEIALVVHARAAAAGDGERPTDDELRAEILERVAAGATRRDAVNIVAERHRMQRRIVYDLAVGLGPPKAGPGHR